MGTSRSGLYLSTKGSRRKVSEFAWIGYTKLDSYYENCYNHLKEKRGNLDGKRKKNLYTRI